MLVLFQALKSRKEPDILVLLLGEKDLIAWSTVQLLDNLTRNITK